jgi:hypothetical protein
VSCSMKDGVSIRMNDHLWRPVVADGIGDAISK